MAYVKTNWADGQAPALSAANMNKIEQGIYDASATADSAKTTAETIANDMADYVIEEGSVTASPTGAFNYYRKWNSGKAEFWYSFYSSSGLTTATWVSPLAFKDMTNFSNIWDGVFVTVNTVHILTRDSQSISIYPLSWTTSGISNMRFVTAGTKSNNAYGISLYAFGTWN